MNTTDAFRATHSPARTGIVARLAAALTARRAARVTADAVEHLDAHLLRDIGLEPSPGERAIRRRLLIG